MITVKKFSIVLLVFAAALSWPSGPISSPPVSFRFPLDDYPVDDDCYYSWGATNPYLLRCGVQTRHVADDACAPQGTDVFAVADGWVRYASKVGECTNNWGWITVTEHTYNGRRVCGVSVSVSAQLCRSGGVHHRNHHPQRKRHLGPHQI